MAPAGDADLEQLPAPGVLLNPKDHKDGTAAVFSNLRNFLLQGHKRGDLQEAGRLVGEGYRCAAVCFIKRESVNGPRSQHAKGLLKILAEVPEWAPQAEMSLPGLEAEADKAKHQLAPAVTAAALISALATTKESLGSLPTQGRLEDPEDINAVFMLLYKWIMDRKKTAPSLADATRMIDVGHRRAIFNFLRAVLERKNAMGQRCREVLKMLATSEEWCTGLDLDQTAVAEALAHSKDLRVQSLGAEVAATVSAPGFGSSSSAEAARPPLVQRAHTDTESITGTRGTPIANLSLADYENVFTPTGKPFPSELLVTPASTTGDSHGGQDGASSHAVTAETPIGSLSLADYESVFTPTGKPFHSELSSTPAPPAREPDHLQAARAAQEAHLLQKNMWSS